MVYKVIYKAKPIIIDGVEFPSIIAAAKMMQVPSGDLQIALRQGVFRGKPIKYKNDWDVPERAKAAQAYRETLHLYPKSERIESVKTNTAMMAAFEEATKLKQKEIKMAKKQGRQPIKVEIDGKIFDSIKLAGEYYKVDPSIISCALRNNKDRKYKGMTIKYADDNIEARIISNFKTEVKPTEPTKENVVEPAVKVIKTKPLAHDELVEKEPQKVDGIELAKTILKNKVIDYIKSDNFGIAKDLMNVIEQIQ